MQSEYHICRGDEIRLVKYASLICSRCQDGVDFIADEETAKEMFEKCKTVCS